MQFKIFVYDCSGHLIETKKAELIEIACNIAKAFSQENKIAIIQAIDSLKTMYVYINSLQSGC